MSDTDQAEPTYDDIPEHWRVAAPGASIYDAADLIEPPAGADAAGPDRMSDEERIALAQRLAEEYAERNGAIRMTGPQAAALAGRAEGTRRRRSPLFVVTALVLSGGAGAGLAALATRDGSGSGASSATTRPATTPGNEAIGQGMMDGTLPAAAATTFDPVLAASATTAPGPITIQIMMAGRGPINGTTDFATGITSMSDESITLSMQGDVRHLWVRSAPDAPGPLADAGVRYRRGDGALLGFDETKIEASFGPSVGAVLEAIRQGRPGGEGSTGGIQVVVPGVVADPVTGSGELTLELTVDDEHRITRILMPPPPTAQDPTPIDIRLSRGGPAASEMAPGEELLAHPDAAAYLAARFPLG